MASQEEQTSTPTAVAADDNVGVKKESKKSAGFDDENTKFELPFPTPPPVDHQPYVQRLQSHHLNRCKSTLHMGTCSPWL